MADDRTRQRRSRNAGTVYQRASDGLWIGAASLPHARGEARRKVTFASKDRAVAEAKLAAWLAEHRPDAPDPDAPLTPPNDRLRSLARARAIATHTEQEWREKRLTYGGMCHYCHRRIDPWGGQPDHVVPIGRGGSDGIDNIVLACLACNRAKHATPADEFIEWAERTGFFTQPRPWERQ